jgi:hypothetical protein
MKGVQTTVQLTYRSHLRALQLRLNFAIALIWWIPGIVTSAFLTDIASCLEIATLKADLALAYTGIVILSLIITMPYTPADGLPTYEPAVDAFAWTDASRERKLSRQRAAMAVRAVHVPPSVRLPQPVFSMETAVKAFAWSCMLYDFEDTEAHEFSTLCPPVCFKPLCLT